MVLALKLWSLGRLEGGRLCVTRLVYWGRHEQAQEEVSVCLLHVHVMVSNRETLSIDKTMTLEN